MKSGARTEALSICFADAVPATLLSQKAQCFPPLADFFPRLKRRGIVKSLVARGGPLRIRFSQDDEVLLRAAECSA